MDRYMNDTHSLYYNVDHSSMFGSNLSTVFADGPPPLEDGDDDHGEFVFSSETDAIGEAVLSKIESKLQRDAEGRPVGDKSGLNPDVEIKPNSSAEKFEAFGNFETSNEIDTSDKQDTNVGLNPEVNGYKGNLKDNSMSNDDFSDDEFGDFSTGFNGQISNFNENGKSNVEKHESNFGDFSTFNNEKSVFSDNEQVSFNGEGENDAKTESNSNDFQFADFSSFGGVDYETNDDDMQSNDNSVIEQQLGKELNSDEMASENENNDASDDEFASFTEANEGDFAKIETNESNGINNLTNPNPDVIPAKEQNDLTSSRLPLDLTNHGTKHNDDEFNSFESSNNDIPSNTTNDLTSAKLPPDLTNHETNSTGNFNSFEAFKDDGFNDFTSSSDNEFPSGEHQTSQSNECQASNPGVSKPDTNSEKCKTEGDTVASPGDDDFGDFADFSNISFNTENQSDAAFGSFSQQNEGRSTHWGDSKLEAFEENSKTDKSKETKVLSRNSSSCSRQDSGEFTAFSESTSSKTEPEFQTDFGGFSESDNSKKQGHFQADFPAFSESTLSKDKPSDFGAFSQNTVSQNTVLSNKQHAIQTRLVSLHGCFQDVFVTLQHRVEDLQHVKVPGEKKINQEDLWKNLHSSMDEGALRFSWGQCKISDKMCKALEVSRKNIMVNPNILAMSEGLEIPVFATGLGILQPSIVPTPPKKKKIKRKQSKEITNETLRSASLTTPPPNLPQQTTFSEFMTESIKDNNSDTASLSNSDTASLDLDFFASAPSNPQANSVDQSSSSSLYNLDIAFGPATAGNQATLVNNQPDLDVFKTTKSVQDDPLEILKKLDTSKMSSSVVSERQTQLSSGAKEIIETFDDLSFMHSSVLMFPLHKNN